MKPKEVAPILGVTYSDVFYLIRTGVLTSTRFGRNGRFHAVNAGSVYQELERRKQKRALLQPPNPSGVCMCGCGRPVAVATRTNTARGIKAGHPIRYLPGHHPNGWELSPVKYIVDKETGCWNWQRSISPEGYPKRMRVDGKSYAPHRFYYEEQHGPIPEDYQIDHLCKNRLCVNPDHLEAVTQLENIRRSSVTKLTEQDVANIKSLFAQGYSKRRLGRMFGVTNTHIADIVNGICWKDIAPMP